MLGPGFQCFDIIGWAAGRMSGLLKDLLQHTPKSSVLGDP